MSQADIQLRGNPAGFALSVRMSDTRHRTGLRFVTAGARVRLTSSSSAPPYCKGATFRVQALGDRNHSSPSEQVDQVDVIASGQAQRPQVPAPVHPLDSVDVIGMAQVQRRGVLLTDPVVYPVGNPTAHVVTQNQVAARRCELTEHGEHASVFLIRVGVHWFHDQPGPQLRGVRLRHGAPVTLDLPRPRPQLPAQRPSVLTR